MYRQYAVDENTWTMEDRMGDGDVVRFFILDGKDKCLVIDSGYLDEDVYKMVKDLLKKEGRDPSGEKPVLLANTHGDGDHIGGNRSFPAFYMTETDYENCGLREICPESEWIPAEEGTVIELGGRTLRYYLAPGHTYGNAVILDVTNRILFPGDMVQTGTIFMFGKHRCPEKMAQSLEKLVSLKPEFDKLYACHGEPVAEPEAIDEVIAAWNKVLNKEIQPVPRTVFDGTTVDMYSCGFCNFFCEKEK